VAGLLLTTEVMVAESPKDDDHKRGGMPDMGGMGMQAAVACHARPAGRASRDEEGRRKRRPSFLSVLSDHPGRWNGCLRVVGKCLSSARISQFRARRKQTDNGEKRRRPDGR
jgi:hypothetical protein